MTGQTSPSAFRSAELELEKKFNRAISSNDLTLDEQNFLLEITDQVHGKYNIQKLRQQICSILRSRSESPLGDLFNFCSMDNQVKSKLTTLMDLNHRHLLLLLMLNSLPDDLAKHVCLAGGAVVNIILKGYVEDDQDYDLFIVGTDQPLKIVKKLTKYLLQEFNLISAERRLKVTNLHLNSPAEDIDYKIQIIHDLYHNPTEVLISFDVDCCGVCFWQKKFYCTPRAHHALTTMSNTLDISQRSNSYEYRLAKYGQRGFCLILDPNTSINQQLAFHTALRYLAISESDRSNYQISPLVKLLIMEALIANKQSLAAYAESSYDQDEQSSTIQFSYTTTNPFKIWTIPEKELRCLARRFNRQIIVPAQAQFGRHTFRRQEMSWEEWSSSELTKN